MDGGFKNFLPVDAMDGAAFRGTAATLVVRATKDADNRVHAMSVSHMSAAESDLSIGAHIQAERSLYAIAESKRVTIVDGGPALLGQVKKQCPQAAVMRCSRHLLDDLSKAAARGGRKRQRDEEDAGQAADDEPETESTRENEIFKKVRYLSRPAAPGIRSKLRSLNGSGMLSRIPEDELCPALLPDGYWTHGVTTNNVAEVVNMMLLPLRRECSMFCSLLRLEKFFQQRYQLHKERLRRVKSAGQKDISAWKSGVVPPAVEEAEGTLGTQAMMLNEPRCSTRDGREVFIVESRSGGLLKKSMGEGSAASHATGKGFAHHVHLESLPNADYDGVCDCGMTGCRPVMCSHARRVIAHGRKDWRMYLKPWLQAEAWEEQVGKSWDSFTSRDIIEKTETLRQTGRLQKLRAGTIDVGMKGRPSNKGSKEAEERAKSFMEELNASEDVTEDTLRLFTSSRGMAPPTVEPHARTATWIAPRSQNKTCLCSPSHDAHRTSPPASTHS